MDTGMNTTITTTTATGFKKGDILLISGVEYKISKLNDTALLMRRLRFYERWLRIAIPWFKNTIAAVLSLFKPEEK